MTSTLTNALLVPRLRDLVADRSWETTSTTTGTGTTVAVPDGTQWVGGDIGEWQTGAVGGEQFYVVSVSVNDLTVYRGYNSTTAETHTSGDRILKNPQYTIRQLQKALNEARDALWPSVWTIGEITLTPDTATQWYDLEEATLGIVSVTQLYGSSDQYAGRFGERGSLPVALDLRLPTALCASGKGLRFPSGIYDSDNFIYVVDKRKILGTDADIDDDIFPVAECLLYLAAGRLIQALEIRRVSRGENADTVGSVGSGARLQTGAYYTNQGNTKKEELKLKLDEYYSPIRMRRSG